jgi:hypothetical protein
MISGKRPATINVTELSANFSRAIKRARGSARFEKYGVLFIGWDWDGMNETGDQELNFTPKSQELEALFREKYGYETLRITLTAMRTEKDARFRRQSASNQLYKESREFLRRFDDGESCLIIVYRGHGKVVKKGFRLVESDSGTCGMAVVMALNCI